MKRRISILMVFVITFYIHGGNEDLTYEQYQLSLKDVVTREETAKNEIAKEQANIVKVKEDIRAIKKAFSNVQSEIDELPGCSPEAISKWLAMVDRVTEILSEIAELTGDELIAKQKELKSLRAKLDKATKLNPALMTANSNALESAYASLSETESLISQAEEEKRLAAIEPEPEPIIEEEQETVIEEEIAINEPAVEEYQTPREEYDHYDTYIVKRNPKNPECLWTISGHSEVYNNSYLWNKIYEGNRETMDKNFDKFIKRFPRASIQRPQDLIYPGQKLRIPRSKPKY